MVLPVTRSTLLPGIRKTVSAVTQGSPVEMDPATTLSPGRHILVDTIIFDLALVSFVILLISLLILPERKATIAIANPAVAPA
jgi:hypothetical protein